MKYQVIDWNSAGHYDPFWVAVGLILLGLLVADFIWIYLKFKRREPESRPVRRNLYPQRKVWEHP